MKKFICICLTILMIFCFTACNYNIIDTKWNFNYAYIITPNSIIEYEIKSWTEDENSITFTTIDGNTFSAGYQNCILTTKECPEIYQ